MPIGIGVRLDEAVEDWSMDDHDVELAPDMFALNVVVERIRD
jgi:hypothetical protein